ncbi:DUF2079 domain-containing protein [Desulfohalobium retbaense]|uniref:DUF2079 domain-containing protein n=1 Tax=Desulfohalobium retbaense (strain ATCC 49708 / DSM 5692 / JCM 16813 / HR100) TaxID=485915 RepID=C8X1P5_DESRD|nr:DUF2079 domain-containing protein [Desulfohalobium retbaense]ACV68467.1 Protein of unknown function DUF2079, membrane [Desulfohalobium retbaense DSM 5692]
MTKFKQLFFLITFFHFVVFLLAGLSRHWGFLTTFVDMAKYEREIINIIQTGKFFSTYSVHFDPIHLIFLPFYAIYPTSTWFIIGQTLAISITGLIIFNLAQRVLESEKLALIWSFIFLINPFLLNAVAWDVDTITLAVPFVALGFVATESKNFKLMLFSSIFILACKEHLGILIIGFGLLWWVHNRQWKQGIGLVIIGIIHFYLVFEVIMPSLSPTGSHPMLAEGLGTASRYGWLGDSLSQMMETLITQPFVLLKTIMISMGGLGYLIILLLPFLFLPLLGLGFLLPGIADLAANMLSSNPMPRSPIAYHSAALIPILTTAAIYGVYKLSKWQKRFSITEISVFVLIASVGLGYVFAPFPLPGAKNVWAPATLLSLPDPRVQEIQYLVQDCSVSVQANVGAHFSNKSDIYKYPKRVEQSDAIILRMKSPTKNIHNYKSKERRRYIIGMLDNHLQMDRNEYLDSIEDLVNNDEFEIAYWDNPWLVFKKGVVGKNVGSEVRARVQELREKW